MTVCMTQILEEARSASASVPLGKSVVLVTMGKVTARSKGKKTDACVMCEYNNIPRSTRDDHETSGGRCKRLGNVTQWTFPRECDFTSGGGRSARYLELPQL